MTINTKIKDTEYIKVIETELPEYVFNLLQHRRIYKKDFKINREKLPITLLDSFGDALSELFQGPLKSMGVVEVIGSMELEYEFKGYGLKIRKEINEGKIGKVLFFQIKPNIVPLTLDLVSLAIALVSYDPIVVLPTTDAIYRVLESLVKLDKEKGDGDLINAYEAYLNAKIDILLKKHQGFPTAKQIHLNLNDWPIDHFLETLWELEARKILEPIEKNKKRFDMSIHWREIW